MEQLSATAVAQDPCCFQGKRRVKSGRFYTKIIDALVYSMSSANLLFLKSVQPCISCVKNQIEVD